MGVAESQAMLTRGAKDLYIRWDLTTETWRDDTRAQFEKKYLYVLRAEVRKSELALDNLDTILSHIRADCR